MFIVFTIASDEMVAPLMPSTSLGDFRPPRTSTTDGSTASSLKHAWNAGSFSILSPSPGVSRWPKTASPVTTRRSGSNP
ncbi:MAG: hypothetical protein M5R36_24460 [Deltaproteobacteria bacterium]|nr:hypothetical protein [Deltaproteobacteria bacterium]